jgi:hypothetical protein
VTWGTVYSRLRQVCVRRASRDGFLGVFDVRRCNSSCGLHRGVGRWNSNSTVKGAVITLDSMLRDRECY